MKKWVASIGFGVVTATTLNFFWGNYLLNHWNLDPAIISALVAGLSVKVFDYAFRNKRRKLVF